MIIHVLFLQSMVGVPRGALGSRPVLSELAGVYGVLLHGAPDGDALAQLPVEPLQVYRGGDASIEDIDTVVVGGRGPSRTGIVHATDPIADGFTARAFTLRTQGLSDQADALEVRELTIVYASRTAAFFCGFGSEHNIWRVGAIFPT